MDNATSNGIGLHRMIPNLITLSALAMGLTAIQMAIQERWETAVMLILVAAVMDTLDGAVARLLKASSDFGAQLDSLSDFCAFGVAPATILYLWSLDEAGKAGWTATLVLAIAVALRLARFNVMQVESAKQPAWKKGFFAGVPSPAGAGLALLPMILWFQAPDLFSELKFALPALAVWILLVAGLMVSRIPTFSLKKLRVPPKMAMPMLTLGGLLMAALIHATWPTLSLILIIYLATIPIAFRRYRKAEAAETATEEDLTDLAIGALTLGQDTTTGSED